MQKVIISILLFLTILFGQETDSKYPHCLNITKYVYENIDSLNNDSLLVFFKQFSIEQNKNNVEFLEWGNEVLFQILEKKPTQFFKNLFILKESEIKSIENEINSPVNDGINMIKIFKEIENSKMDEKIKARALNFIRPAYESYKNMIEEWEKKNNEKYNY